MKLTVLVPYYNQQRFLEYCLSRTSKEMEVLVLNFGSDSEPDTSCFPWVRVHNDERDVGIAAQLNWGVENTGGDFIVWVPADNALLSPHLIPAVAWHLQHYDIVYTDMAYIDDDDRLQFIRPLPDWDFHTCLDTYELGVSIWYKRSAHKRFGMFDENYQVHDYEWLLRCAQNGATFYHMPHPMYAYRSHDKRPEGNWTQERERVMLEQSAELSKRAKAT